MSSWLATGRSRFVAALVGCRSGRLVAQILAKHLRARLPVKVAGERLARYFEASVELMQVLARAAGHRHLSGFAIDDLTTFKKEMSELTGVAYGGVAG